MLPYDVWTITRGLFVEYRNARKENPVAILRSFTVEALQLCPAANDHDIVWQRDVNAALNIHSILVSYVKSNYSILSRYPSLKRESTSGGDQATSQPLDWSHGPLNHH
ncbi:hypothetical protein G6F70_005674 [Rhizopus microsporus]|nr:hypothetical protein G6F71_005498 [Rhizopus microsporus]KAG1198565.1 hypothetical protein G6F70_005674 [Rhizopus microsporus]KAG1210289.1 hypothetical protein G6F69_005605 [Rhizopus microsporus]KAG1235528.1 hypothetical protein G6F67_002693 [Rhizopus microsporus]KAG1264705.1 hypothetical protein G6F68_004143 [Rhizopus microsporus]